MTKENKDGWKTQIRQEREDSESNGIASCVGTISTPSSRTRDDSFGTSRTNSNQSNTSTFNSREGSSGGIARQLIDETEKQLAYHKRQVCELEARLNELHQFNEGLQTEELDEQLNAEELEDPK